MTKRRENRQCIAVVNCDPCGPVGIHTEIVLQHFIMGRVSFNGVDVLEIGGKMEGVAAYTGGGVGDGEGEERGCGGRG